MNSPRQTRRTSFGSASLQQQHGNTALLVIDLQNDFMPGGALEVPGAPDVLTQVNKVRRSCRDGLAVVVYTQDYHPLNHISFASSHCASAVVAPGAAGCVKADGARLETQLQYDKATGELLSCSLCGAACPVVGRCRQKQQGEQRLGAQALDGRCCIKEPDAAAAAPAEVRAGPCSAARTPAAVATVQLLPGNDDRQQQDGAGFRSGSAAAHAGQRAAGGQQANADELEACAAGPDGACGDDARTAMAACAVPRTAAAAEPAGPVQEGPGNTAEAAAVVTEPSTPPQQVQRERHGAQPQQQEHQAPQCRPYGSFTGPPPHTAGPVAAAAAAGGAVVLRQRQRLWPAHCMAGQPGADLHPDLLGPLPDDIIVRKGTHAEVDGYSAFFDNGRLHSSGLHEQLQERGVGRLVLCGVATEFCVLWSARDAADLGYEVWLISDAVRGLGGPEEEEALKEMSALRGVTLRPTEHVITSCAKGRM